MAKVGEGDPRWVVKERADGTNVGNWHWSGERDCLAWSARRLRELLAAVRTPTHRVAAVEKVDGDATLYNRKGALKAVFDLRVTGAWEAVRDDDDARPKGTFLFELFDDDPQISAAAPDHPGEKARFLHACGPAMRAACAVYIKEMLDGADLPEAQRDGAAAAKDAKKASATPAAAPPRLPERAVSDYMRTPGVDVASKEFRDREQASAPLSFMDVFTCSRSDLFQAIVADPKRLAAVTRSNAFCDPTVGGKWEVRGGEARGVFREVRTNERAVMDWRLGAWSKDVPDCKLTLEFIDTEGRTQLRVNVEGVENSRKSAVEGFWRLNILQAVKVIFGYGRASFL